MAMKRGAVLLITVFLATASLSLGYSSSGPKEKLDECLDRCQSRYPGSMVPMTCVGQCAEVYYKEMESQDDNSVDCHRQCKLEPREQRGPCVRSCLSQQDRRERLQSCQRRCSDLGYPQQLPCQSRCATVLGFRGQDANTMLEQCQRQCQFKPMRQQPPCFKSCDAKFPQQDTKLEECQRECQFKPRWQQEQCFRGCESQSPQQQDTKWDKLEECQRRCSQSRIGIFGQGSCQAKCASEFGFGQ